MRDLTPTVRPQPFGKRSAYKRAITESSAPRPQVLDSVGAFRKSGIQTVEVVFSRLCKGLYFLDYFPDTLASIFPRKSK